MDAVSEAPRQNWYFVPPTSRLGDVYNMLHVPYTAMLLAFVAIGASVAPELHPDRLAAALVAYFLGLGIGAHAVDQLEPNGTHYVKRLGERDLKWLAALGLAGGTLVGVYYIFALTVWLAPLVAVNLFFALAYPLPSRVAGGLFHNNTSFAFAWGFLPAFTSYFAGSLAVASTGLVASALTGFVAWTEIRLSRGAREARKEGLDRNRYTQSESALKLLVLGTCLAGAVMVSARYLLGSLVI